MRNKLKIDKYIAAYFLIAFVPRFILIQFIWPFVTPLDEVSTLALPAYLAGYDWSYLMGRTQYYYGYGMAVLFMPVFGLVKDPILLYRTILTVCAMLQIVPGLIAFHILGKFFNQRSYFIKLLLSLIASYCVCCPATMVVNEHMLYAIAWVIGWMLLELINCKIYWQKNIYTCALVFVSFYAIMCHERAKVFVIALICLVILYRLVEKKLLISPVAFLVMSSFVYKINLLMTAKVQSVIWPVNDAEDVLSNTSVSIPIILLKNKDLWHVWYNIILGQLGTGAVFTGGAVVIAIVLGIWMFTKKIVTMRSGENCVESNYFYIIFFGLLTIGAIIFAQSLTWLENAKSAVIDSTLSEGGRAFTYLRYYFPCVGIIVVLSLNWLISHKGEKISRNIMGISFLLVIMLQMNFILGIIPLIEKTPILNYIHNSYWIFSFMDDGAWTNRCTFLPACIICVLFFAVFLLFIARGKRELAISLLVVLLGYQYIMTGITEDIPRSAVNYHAVKDTCEVLEKMKKDSVLPYYIGVTGERVESTYQPTRFIYQYFLKERRVSYYDPVVGVDEAVYLTAFDTIPMRTITEDTDAWFRIELTESQYIFFKGDRLKEYFSKSDYDYCLIEMY